MADLIKKLDSLPPNIVFGQFEFRLLIIPEGMGEIRIVYEIAFEKKGCEWKEVKKGSTWWNPFNDRYCDYLYLVEGIYEESDMREGIKEIKNFLRKNNLL